MAHLKRRTLVAPDMNLSLDQSEGSVLSDEFLETPDDLDINVDDIETPDETDSLEFINNGNELEWEGQSFRWSILKMAPFIKVKGCMLEFIWEANHTTCSVLGLSPASGAVSFWQASHKYAANC